MASHLKRTNDEDDEGKVEGRWEEGRRGIAR